MTNQGMYAVTQARNGEPQAQFDQDTTDMAADIGAFVLTHKRVRIIERSDGLTILIGELDSDPFATYSLRFKRIADHTTREKD